MLLERATALDPDFAPAYAELAWVRHYYLGLRSGTRSRAEQVERGLRLARTLMHTANCYNPIRPPLHEFYLARALAWTGHFDKALPLAQSCLGRTPGFWPCERHPTRNRSLGERSVRAGAKPKPQRLDFAV